MPKAEPAEIGGDFYI